MRPEIAVIRIDNLHKSFGSQKVLRGVHLEIPDQAVFAVVGGSGAGKSCLLKHVIGLLRPDAGRVWVDDVDVTRLGRRALNRVRTRFGMLFQGGALFDSMSVYDNVAFPLREKTRKSEAEINAKVEERLFQVGLAGGGDKFPSELSGGMRKRAALARALVSDPEILLFDEPTTGLDPIRVNAIHRLIQDLHGLLGFTAVIVSHEIPAVFSLATHVAMLHRGVIVESGSPADLQASDEPVVRQFLSGALDGPIDVH